MTAAHCDISPKRHLVYLGTRVRHSPAHARYVARIERVDVHRMYRFTGGTDVALVTLRDDGDKRKINNRNGNSDSAFARRLKKAGIRPVDVDWGGLGLRVQGLRLYTMGFG